MTDQDLRARTVWRNAIVAVALNLVGMATELAIRASTPGLPVWPPLLSMGCALVLLGLLIATRRRPSVALGNTVFLLNVAAVLTAFWFLDIAYVSSGRPWVPFQGHKLGMVTVGLLAPELWVGLVSVGAYVVAALVQLGSLEAMAHGKLALGEPWATIVIGLFSGILLAYRMRQNSLVRDMARATAHLEATEQLAKVLLAVRDLANTPLQTIALASASIREVHPDIGRTLDRLDRSLDKLSALDHRLSGHDTNLHWTGREESLDAIALATNAARKPRR